MQEREIHTKFGWDKLSENVHLDNLDVNGRTLLKWISGTVRCMWIQITFYILYNQITFFGVGTGKVNM